MRGSNGTSQNYFFERGFCRLKKFNFLGHAQHFVWMAAAKNISKMPKFLKLFQIVCFEKCFLENEIFDSNCYSQKPYVDPAFVLCFNGVFY